MSVGEISHERLIDHVRERDVDLVILSALYASEAFRSRLLDHVVGWQGAHTLIRACVSEPTADGETDVLFVVSREDGQRLAVMIEDKIDAQLQPDQAARYRRRGEEGILTSRWDRFVTCLCAPEGYLGGERAQCDWDAYVPLEAVADWSARSNDAHLQFLAVVLREAIAKRDRQRKESSAEATAFWAFYRRLVTELLPSTKLAGVGASVSTSPPWPRFVAPGMPRDLLLEHKPNLGRVDLTFNGYSAAQAKARVTFPVPLGVVWASPGSSTALRIAVPRIDHLKPYQEQQDEVLAALAAVERLLEIARHVTPAAPVS